jgi:hypothetical protein
LDEGEKLDAIFSAEEASERLRITKRKLIKIARETGNCSRLGRDYLFSEADLLAVWQGLREPATPRERGSSSLELPHQVDYRDLLPRPPTRVDARVLNVLRWLERQKEPLSHEHIGRAGKRTIEKLLLQGFVVQSGESMNGSKLVRITPAGRDQIKIAERWERRRKAQSGG